MQSQDHGFIIRNLLKAENNNSPGLLVPRQAAAEISEDPTLCPNLTWKRRDDPLTSRPPSRQALTLCAACPALPVWTGIFL